MPFRNLTKKDIGKYVTFRPVTRWGTPKVKRKITHVFRAKGDRSLGVTYNGCSPFYVHSREIIGISKD